MNHVYILTNRANKVLYIGVTSNIVLRMKEHREGLVEGFSKKYQCMKLVYAEEAARIEDAIAREKQLKNWHRDWKINLINELNPDWDDLSENL